MEAGSVAQHTKFQVLCDLCEKVSLKSSKEERNKLVEKFINRWREGHSKLHKDDQTSDSIYPALRLLLPKLEKERPAYGVKEIMLAKLYIDVLCLSKNSQEAQKLLNFKNPRNAHAEAGDFSAVAFQVLRSRCPQQGSLTIAEVNSHLDTVAASNNAENKDSMKKSLLHLLRNMSALEQKWLIRMILKEMRLGISENTILKIFHPDAIDLYDHTTSLENVCLKLPNPKIRLHEIEIKLFSHFRPMLAEMMSPAQVDKLKESFYIETKYDGERTQLHKLHGAYKYFSRNGVDLSTNYGASGTEGPLTRHLHPCFSQVSSCILDGEMVGFNVEQDCIGTKGEGLDVKHLADGKDFQQCYCVFDILMLNDRVLTSLPYTQRLALLAQHLQPLPGRLIITSSQEASGKETVVEALNQAIELREEGIMLKLASSIYKPNSRSSGWYKVKPEYVDGLMDQLDLLIVGGYYGGGRRRSGVSHFLVAAASGEGHWVSVTSVGSGYSMAELASLLARLQPHWRTWDSPPPHLVLGSGGTVPDLWLPPQHSAVLQIKASEIVASEKFGAKVTLRFPRVEKVRTDKSWKDVLTLEQLLQMQQMSSGKLANRLYVSSLEESSPKKRKVTKQEVSVSSFFTAADISSVQAVSSLFNGRQFCIFIASPKFSPSKHELEKKVVEHGGSVVQNPVDLGCCVIADTINLKVKNIISAGNYDVARVEWLLRCLEQGVILPWSLSDLWYSTPATKSELDLRFDQWGDSYSEDTSIQQLKKVFEKIEPKDLSSEDIWQLEQEYELQHKGSIFRNMRLYSGSSLLGWRARLYGATLAEDILDRSITHVLMPRDDSDMPRIQAANRERQLKFHLVTEAWITECICKGLMLDERTSYLQSISSSSISMIEELASSGWS